MSRSPTRFVAATDALARAVAKGLAATSRLPSPRKRLFKGVPKERFAFSRSATADFRLIPAPLVDCDGSNTRFNDSLGLFENSRKEIGEGRSSSEEPGGDPVHELVNAVSPNPLIPTDCLLFCRSGLSDAARGAGDRLSHFRDSRARFQ